MATTPKVVEQSKPNSLFEATVKNMLNTPPQPRKPTAKPKTKKKTAK